MKNFCRFAVLFVVLQPCFADETDPSLRVLLDDANSVFQSVQSTIQSTNTGSTSSGMQGNSSADPLITDSNNVFKSVQSAIQPPEDASIAEQSRISRKKEQAIKNGNWSEAEKWARLQLRYETTSANQASVLVSLSLLYWNIGQRREAARALRAAIYIMDHDKMLGSNCSGRANIFLRKMEAGNLPEVFTFQDLQRSPGIHWYIMEIPYAVSNSKYQAQIARSDALIGAANARLKALEIRNRMEANAAKFEADTEYRKTTGRKFDPYHRPYGGAERDAWDSCKRIHDIWDR